MQSNSHFFPAITFRHQYRACTLGLLALVAAVVWMTTLILQQGIVIETSLQALLPKDEGQKLLQLASDKLFAANGNKVVFLLEAQEREQALQAAQMVQAKLGASSYFSLIDDAFLQQRSSALVNELSAHRFNFLSPSQRENLAAGNVDTILRDAEMALFDLASSDGILPPDKDPLGLFNRWFSSVYTPPENILREDGFLFVAGTDNKLTSVLVLAELNGDALGTKTQTHVAKLVGDINQALPGGVTLSRSGMIFHAYETAAKAKSDITLVAVGSTIGIIVLFLFAFASPKPLVVSLLSILFGCVAGAVVTHSIYGQLHIFTLVFGASLIGVTVDYSLHFFVRLYYQKDDASAYDAIAGIFPEIFAGLLTSLVGFGCLLQSSLPGLDQIAMFSMVGLVSGWLFVVVVYPKICRMPREVYTGWRYQKLSFIAQVLAKVWQNIGIVKTKIIYSLLFIVAVAALLFGLQWSNDIRSLNVTSPELLAEEGNIRQKLTSQASNQFFIISADSAEALLLKEENFRPQLNALVETSALYAYQAVSTYLPSQYQQQQDYQLIKTALFSESAVMSNFMQNVGFSTASIEDYKQHFTQQKQQTLAPQQWLESASPELAMLWLGKLDNQYASIIALSGVTDVLILGDVASAIEGVAFVDKVADISTSLSVQRDQAAYLLALAYVGIALLLLLKFRRASSLSLVVVPLLSSLLSLMVLSLFNVEIGLFHVFGLFLVLGLGMDYGIFLTGPASENDRVLVAIFLSAITSCLSFGLLSLSSIPMINAFGVTILLGSLLNLVLVPIIPLLGASNKPVYTQ